MTAAAKLTPAGLQVEDALKTGHEVAAFNLYYANIRDDVPMTEGEWPEWHRMIQAGIGEGEVIGEQVANEEADELGLAGEDREDFVAGRIDELNEHEPSIVEWRVRNAAGEVVDVELVPNPDMESE